MNVNRFATAVRLFTTSAVKSNRRGKKISKNKKLMEYKLSRPSLGPFWYQSPVVPSSPLSKTEHPKSRFEDDEDEVMKAIKERSKADEPIEEEVADPYCREKLMCILCPRRYSIPIEPNYKNPKLLAQFVSPHTGFVYQKHITGLCEHMQEKVEKETKRAQHAGFMSTKIKEIHYFKDHALFNPSRPSRRNPI